MSYKMDGVVGRFTSEDRADFVAKNPGSFVQRVVDSLHAARDEALRVAENMIADGEQVLSIRQKESTEAGWIFSVTVQGR